MGKKVIGMLETLMEHRNFKNLQDMVRCKYHWNDKCKSFIKQTTINR